MAKHRTEADRVRSLLLDTVFLLVKNGTSNYLKTLTVEGVIGVTVDKGSESERVFVAHIDRTEKAEEETKSPEITKRISSENVSSRKRRHSLGESSNSPVKNAKLETPPQPPSKESDKELPNTQSGNISVDKTQPICSSQNEVVFGDLCFSLSSNGTWQFFHRDLPGFIYKRQSASATSNRWRCARHGKPVCCLATARTNIVPGFGPMGPGPLVSFTGEHNHPPSDLKADQPPAQNINIASIPTMLPDRTLFQEIFEPLDYS